MASSTADLGDAELLAGHRPGPVEHDREVDRRTRPLGRSRAGRRCGPGRSACCGQSGRMRRRSGRTLKVVSVRVVMVVSSSRSSRAIVTRRSTCLFCARGERSPDVELDIGREHDPFPLGAFARPDGRRLPAPGLGARLVWTRPAPRRPTCWPARPAAPGGPARSRSAGRSAAAAAVGRDSGPSRPAIARRATRRERSAGTRARNRSVARVARPRRGRGSRRHRGVSSRRRISASGRCSAWSRRMSRSRARWPASYLLPGPVWPTAGRRPWAR